MSSSNPIYWPSTLPLPLMSPVRELRPRAEIHRMESKRVRVRRYYTDHLAVHTFEWNFTGDQFEEFKAFFEEDLTNGQDPFTIITLDPLDSSQQATIEYGFFEAAYQWSYSNGVYAVSAVVIVETEIIEQLPEPFAPELCAVTIMPAVSDGEGGGTTFDCYAVGDYTLTTFELAGTGIDAIYHGNSPYGFIGGETFSGFPDGALFLGSPSVGSFLLLMRYGDDPFGLIGGVNFDFEDAGNYVDGDQDPDSELLVSYEGDGP